MLMLFWTFYLFSLLISNFRLWLVVCICHSLFPLVSCSVWSAAVHALTAFIKCFISPNFVNGGVLLQPVLVYLSRYNFLVYLLLFIHGYESVTFIFYIKS